MPLAAQLVRLLTPLLSAHDDECLNFTAASPQIAGQGRGGGGFPVSWLDLMPASRLFKQAQLDDQLHIFDALFKADSFWWRPDSACRPIAASASSLALLGRAAVEDVARLLARRDPGLAPAEATRLAEVAEGSIGYALELGEQGGLAMLDEVSSLLSRLPDGLPVKELHDFAGRMGGAGKEAEFEAFAKTLRWWLERLIIAGGGGPLPGIIDAQVAERLNAMASLDRWLEVWEKVSRLLAATTAVNLDRKQVVLNAFITAEAAVRR